MALHRQIIHHQLQLGNTDNWSSSIVLRAHNLEDLKSYDFESSFLLSQTFCPVSKCRTFSVSNGFLTDSSTRAMQTAGQLLRQSLFAGIVQMTIDVCCHLNIAVTHPFLYILEVAAVIQKQTGAAMTKLVKTNMRKTVLFQKVRELPRRLRPHRDAGREYRTRTSRKYRANRQGLLL